MNKKPYIVVEWNDTESEMCIRDRSPAPGRSALLLVTLALGAWPGRLPDDSGQTRTTPRGVRPFPAFPVALVQAPLCAYAHA